LERPNRAGQITAGGYVNSEPLALCPSFDYETGTAVLVTTPCRNLRMFVLTPVGR
jgi:hypothetical protein